MLNPWFWLNPLFATPQDTMAEAAAAEQKRSEAMINPVPCFGPPLSIDEKLWKAILDWRFDHRLDVEVSDIELEDLLERLSKFIKSLQEEEKLKRDAEAQAIETDREKGTRTAYKV